MSKHEMLKLIEEKRAELIDIVLKNGINSTISIQFSQELDILLNQYIKDDIKQKNRVYYS
ncbi:aspartyl-phosphate phosphatase Spo0E family protein [Metabacillus bambusae]|nr:aspartyl-phosphate phosphatase Spo0E family protein [Metabacillus bambusae]